MKMERARKRLLQGVQAIGAAAIVLAASLMQVYVGAKWFVRSHGPVVTTVRRLVAQSGVDSGRLLDSVQRAEHIARSVVGGGLSGIGDPNAPAALAREAYHIWQDTATKPGEPNRTTHQPQGNTTLITLSDPGPVQNRESDPMMSAYLENRLADFRQQLERADEQTVRNYLALAIDQQRVDFLAAILEKMPPDWNADALVEELVEKHAFHSLNPLLDYTSEEKHADWLALAIDHGDADIVAALYERLPETDAAAQAEKVYHNIHSANTQLAKARHITVFEVFRPALPAAAIKEYYERAARDGEMCFAQYLKTRL